MTTPPQTASAPSTARAPVPVTERLAAVRLYNPTGWSGAAVVEVPVGQLASPGVIDWRRVRLRMGGRDLAFAIREGRAHWKASLTAPIRTPRAEDVLVFSCTVPSGRHAVVEVLHGRPVSGSALRRRDGRLAVSYPSVTASIDAATGMLQSVRFAGTPALAKPMSARAFVATPRPVKSGEYNPGPTMAPYDIPRTAPLPDLKAQLVGSSSTPAMTELHFVLRTEGLSLGLTYRIHAAGLVEILADERPWTGASPWTTRAVDYQLDIAGVAESLPLQENRAPLYGFHEFTAAVRYPSAVHRIKDMPVVALGEETVNGRRWTRSLYPASGGVGANLGPLVDLATEGLVVTPEPAAIASPGGQVRVAHPADCRAAADVLRKGIADAGLAASLVPESAGGPVVRMRIAKDAASHGISGDGFLVRKARNGGLDVAAGTRFGLLQAAHQFSERISHSTKPAGSVLLPLIASNPTTDLRAGGFGGGDFEVDFPYGDTAEWERVLSELAASGMNVMADLGMWSNWKMPVSYREMPELRSNSPDAYDEVSGAKFAEFDKHRENGLKLLRFLHDRGVRVWIWLPIGAVPTTYAAAHPDAMSPTNAKTPCFTHPLYQRYLETFLKELCETYPVDGVVMIRDDNGGVCDCDRCKTYLAGSRTKSPAWEQYLILYDRLRRDGFKGDVSVYPYIDHYDPHLEPTLPTDLLIVGHGAGLGVLTRSYDQVGPMGDTWLDNPVCSFRLPGLARMRKLLADRPSLWIGGAYHASEMPWLSVGRFGWDASATVNTVRWEEGRRRFGTAAADAFVRFGAAYDRLADLYALPALPLNWVKLTNEQQRRTSIETREYMRRFRAGLSALRKAAAPSSDPSWFDHAALIGAFYEANTLRLERLDEMRRIAADHKERILAGQRLPEQPRRRLLDLYAATYRDADALDTLARAVPGNMMARTRESAALRPCKEWGLQPWGYYLDWALDHKQFAGAIEAGPVAAQAGRPFTLRIEIRNQGIVPWVQAAPHRIDLGGDAARLGLPAAWVFAGDPVAPGDRTTIELTGTAPPGQGEAQVTLGFFPPFATTEPTMRTTARITWKP